MPSLRFRLPKELIPKPCRRTLSSTRTLHAKDESTSNPGRDIPPPPPAAKPSSNPWSTASSSLQQNFLNDLISKNITPSPSKQSFPPPRRSPRSSGVKTATASGTADSSLTSMLSQLEAVSSAGRKPAPRGGSRGEMLANRQSTLAQLGARELEQNLRKKLGRRWKEGDVYGPYELGPVEQQKWMQMKQAGRDRDVFQVMRKSPLSFYKNFTVLSEFMTETGRIMHSKETGLRPKTQRKVAKAIRRAVGIGLIPSVHKHPQLLGAREGIYRDN